MQALWVNREGYIQWDRKEEEEEGEGGREGEGERGGGGREGEGETEKEWNLRREEEGEVRVEE